VALAVALATLTAALAAGFSVARALRGRTVELAGVRE
jgi:F0F1-type ATP synthase membrane subunit c/vacuolar-type H+-ATPase subunit K